MFDKECFPQSDEWIIAAEATCNLNCTGRCPNHVDTECAAPELCIVLPGGAPSNVPAPAQVGARGLPRRDPPSRPLLPPRQITKSCCCLLRVCALLASGEYDQCISCDPADFASTCIYLSQEMLEAAEERCDLTCKPTSATPAQPKFSATTPGAR